jgi:hypothetical protein
LKVSEIMTHQKQKNVALWTVQGVLAGLFLFAGSTKWVLPPEMLNGPVALPLGFLRFIGAAEIVGALGLVLPGILRNRRYLTPLAAQGLAIIMVGATIVTLMGGAVAPALIPAAVGALAVVVALGRRHSPDSIARRTASPLERVSRSALKA